MTRLAKMSLVDARPGLKMFPWSPVNAVPVLVLVPFQAVVQPAPAITLWALHRFFAEN